MYSPGCLRGGGVISGYRKELRPILTNCGKLRDRNGGEVTECRRRELDFTFWAFTISFTRRRRRRVGCKPLDHWRNVRHATSTDTIASSINKYIDGRRRQLHITQRSFTSAERDDQEINTLDSAPVDETGRHCCEITRTRTTVVNDAWRK